MGSATHQTAPIFRLSDELLLSIFTDLYYATIADLDFAPPSKLTGPGLFPACVANVCRHWRKVVRLVPLFETRVVIHVDGRVVLSELKTRLAASKSELIGVYVVRRDYPIEDVDGDNSAECGAVRDTVTAIAPHVARLRVLVFDVLHAAALPRVADLAGLAPKLRTFRVKCRQPNRHLLSQNGGGVDPFICPKLQYLDLYGPVFIAALVVPEWIASMKPISGKQLSISHLFSPGFDLRMLLSAIANLGHLTKLYLKDVSLDPSTCHDPGRAPEMYVQNIELEDCSREVVAALGAQYGNRIDLSSLTLTRCGLAPMPISAWHLRLGDIAAGEDIRALVRAWDGYSLRVDNCAGADDTLLAVLTTRDSRDRFAAPTLRELHLSGTDEAPLKVSSGALMHLVAVRKKEAEGYWWPLDPHGPLPMHTIMVRNAGSELKPGQKEWFEERLEGFSWGVIAALRSPVLDGDCTTWDFSEFDDGKFTALALPPPLSIGEIGDQSSGGAETESGVFLPPFESGQSSEFLEPNSRVLLPPPESQEGEWVGTQESFIALIEPTSDADMDSCVFLDELCDRDMDECVLPPTQVSNASNCMGPDESLSSSQFSVRGDNNYRSESFYSQV